MISNKTLNIISVVILTLYMSLITTLKIYGLGYEINLIVLLIINILYFLLFKFILNKTASIVDLITFNNNKPKFVWIKVSIITLVVYTFYLIADNPGGMSGDSFTQMSQALGNSNYSDWHPVIHTLITFALPLRIYENVVFASFLQGLWFSLAFGYLCKVMSEQGLPNKLLLIICVFIYINPMISSYYLYLWKDIMFSIVSIVLFAQYIQIVLTKGKWLSKTTNLVSFSIFAVLSWYMRHNGLMFALPLIAIVICYFKGWENKLKLILCFLLFFSSIKVLYKAMDVEKPASRVVETIGLPLTIWSNVMKNNPDSLSSETKELLLTFATQDSYDNYETGNFNPTKWGGANLDNINKLTYTEVVEITIECFKCDFKSSLEAFSKLTDTVWDLYTKHGTASLLPEPNSYGVEHKDNFLTSITKTLRHYLNIGPERSIFGSIGLYSFLILFLGCLLLNKRRLVFIHALPLLCYNYGTMLLLTGPDYRFFALNLVIWIPTAFIILKDKSITIGKC